MCKKCKSRFDRYIYHLEEMIDIGTGWKVKLDD